MTTGENPGWEDGEDDGTWVRLVSARPALGVPHGPGLSNAHALAAFRAADVVWVERTYVRYTHSYACVRIYIHRHT